jgi:hypothetical protein
MGNPKLDLMGDRLQREDLSTFQYFTRNLLVGSTIEGALRSFGFVTSSLIGPQNNDALSLRHLPQLLGFNFIPKANGETPDSTSIPNSLENTQPTNSSQESKVARHISDLRDRAMEIGPVKSIFNYISDNRQWLLITGSVIGIHSVVNYLASKKIHNCLVRNVISIGVGVGATWVGYNYGLGIELDFTKTADIANRFFWFHSCLKFSEPMLYRLIGFATTTVSIAVKPMAYPKKKG